jgi:hypothetical protein
MVVLELRMELRMVDEESVRKSSAERLDALDFYGANAGSVMCGLHSVRQAASQHAERRLAVNMRWYEGQCTRQPRSFTLTNGRRKHSILYQSHPIVSSPESCQKGRP